MKEDPGLSDASRAAAIQRRVRAAYKNWPREMIIDMNTTGLTGESDRKLGSRHRLSAAPRSNLDFVCQCKE